MNNFRSLSVAAILIGIAIVACGDKVTIPTDKTGKCVAGLLKKCGDTCVDTQTDNNNCGDCMIACSGTKICVAGKCADACPPSSTRCGDKCVSTDVDRTNCGMCGKACAGNEICAKGKCAASCEAAGYTTCSGMNGMLDAGGAMDCVDTTRDPNNCGGCGISCGGGNVCSNGVCCPAGHIACNGQCVNPNADANNCGVCGTVCSMAAPNCVSGQCSKCKQDILILSDGQTSVNTNITNAFKAAGFRPTTVDKGSTTYNGMPDAKNFGAVFIIVGNDFFGGPDMPVQGQQSITAAQAAGTGVVFDGFGSYIAAQYGRYQTLKSIMLLSYPLNGGFYSAATVQAPQLDPFFTGIPGVQFTMANSNPHEWFNMNIISGQSVATNITNNIIAEASRAMPNGRIVHFSACPNYDKAASAWANDANTTQWFIDGVRWAAGCTN